MNCFNRFFHSFGWAAQGIMAAIRQERNFRFHLVALAYLCYFQHFYDLNQGELALLLLCAGLVLCCELLNTAIERAVDLLSPGYHPLAKLAKDAAAGAVLVAAVFSSGTASAGGSVGAVPNLGVLCFQPSPPCGAVYLHGSFGGIYLFLGSRCRYTSS